MKEIIWLTKAVWGRSLWWCFGKLECFHHCIKKVFKPATVIHKTLFLENTTGCCWPVVTFYCPEPKPWKLWISSQFPRNHINFLKWWPRLNHSFCNNGWYSELSNKFWDVCYIIPMLNWGVYIVVAWGCLKPPSKFAKPWYFLRILQASAGQCYLW